jgi:hypothetical protein
MVVITFPDGETQKKALGFLLGRFSGKVLKNGEHMSLSQRSRRSLTRIYPSPSMEGHPMHLNSQNMNRRKPTDCLGLHFPSLVIDHQATPCKSQMEWPRN